MSSRIQFSCIIPCFNEAPRVRSVLRTVTRVKTIDEIICVDDGSSDGTDEIIANEFPQIRLIKLKENSGKSNAISKGLLAAKGKYIVLVDADLKGLKSRELQNAVEVMRSDMYDMIVMRRTMHPYIVKLLRGDILIPGERIVRKTILAEVLNKNVNGFQIEAALNRYSLEKSLRTGWMPNSALSVPWIVKVSFMKGIHKDVLMFYDLYRFLGLKGIVQQYLYFCRDRAE